MVLNMLISVGFQFLRIYAEIVTFSSCQISCNRYSIEEITRETTGKFRSTAQWYAVAVVCIWLITI